MQPFVGVLVEYIVIGAISLLWIAFLLLKITDVDTEQLTTWNLLSVIPIAYLLGMVSDYLGYLVLRHKRENMKQIINGDELPKTSRSTGELCAYLAAYSPALLKEITMRSSRYRIVRGVLVNIPFIVASIAYWMWQRNTIKSITFVIILGVLTTVAFCALFFFIWKKHQESTLKYEKHARMILKGILQPKGLPLENHREDQNET